MVNTLKENLRIFLYDEQLLKKDVYIFSLIIFLIPIALITGPAIPDILLSIIALYFLIKSISNKDIWYYYKNYLVIGFILFCFYGIIRSLFSDLIFESLFNEGSVFYFRYIFFAMGVLYISDNNPNFFKCLLIVCIICLVFFSLDAVYQYFNFYNFFGNPKLTSQRLTGVFGDEPIIGRYISYLSIITVVLIFQIYKMTKNVILIVIFLLIFSLLVIFLSGERAPLLQQILFIFLIFLTIHKYHFVKFISIISVIFLITFFFQFNNSSKVRMIDNTLNEVSKTSFPYLPYNLGYEYIYGSAIKMFLDNPLFGVGTNTFKYQCSKDKYFYHPNSCNTHPHQYYLQVLSELGLIGFSFIFCFYAYIFYIVSKYFFNLIFLRKKIPLEKEYFVSILALFVFWWPIIPNMSLYNNWNNVFIMIPLAFLIKYFKNNK